MSWTEHTPHTHEMRETAEPPPSPNTPEIPPAEPVETENATEKTHITTDVQKREVHIYTYPNRESGHYPDSGVFRDILNNPTLYMDRADF